MFERYMICEDGFRNTWQDGKVTGFELKVRICYYRGIALSLVEDFEVTVDGETFKRDKIRFGVRSQSFGLDEMEEVTNVRWNFGEKATLYVEKPGGLEPGEHDVHVMQRLRISYMPFPYISHADKKLKLEI